MYAKNLVGLDFSWQRRAACHPDNRPADVRAEWFAVLDYRPKGRAVDEPSVRKAIALCHRCPVIRQCAMMAQADRGGVSGVWAGKYIRGYGAEE